MSTEVLLALIGILSIVVSSVVTFFLTKRKYNTEVESQQIQNMEAAFSIYKKTMEENLSFQKQTMEETIASQNRKIETLQKENDSLRNQVNALQMQLIKYLGAKFTDVTINEDQP